VHTACTPGKSGERRRKSRAWWDTTSWEEFERRLRQREQMEAALRHKFLNQMQGRYQHRRLRSQVLNAERTCEQLDRRGGLGESELWPPELRELQFNKAEMEVAKVEGAPTAWEELLARAELDSREVCSSRLVDLLTHLRMVHVYCLHCGCHFEDAEDLERSCPGFDEDAHENAASMAMVRGGVPPPGVKLDLQPPPKRPRCPLPDSSMTQEDDQDNLQTFLGGGRARRRPVATQVERRDDVRCPVKLLCKDLIVKSDELKHSTLPASVEFKLQGYR